MLAADSDNVADDDRRRAELAWSSGKSVITSRIEPVSVGDSLAERSRSNLASDLNGHLSDNRNATSSGSSNGEYPSSAPCMTVHNDGHNPHNAAYFSGQVAWERDLNTIKLEYMDLDEFLPESNRNSVRGPHQGGQLQQHLHQHRQQMQMSYTRNSNEDLGNLGMRFANAKPRGDANAYPGYCNVQSMDEHYPKDGKSPESPNQLVNVECGFTRNDLALATIPGQEDFDPSSHSFSEDELKPQPIIKKSRKQFVPPELKDEKYWARRQKNNIAAKRSREVRRVKENQIVLRASFLEKENVALREEVRKLIQDNERLLQRLRKYEN